ncbi:hypothetical protein [Rudanella lutea]|uniref:hypothetical protein n=1 Tax=Rudanella lutea TaxID=451374 RepID=UPI0003737467|nr:hypothetical protein [Rudanella lutea]
MQYINPIELFFLQNVDPSTITTQDIRKARKKLIAELSLSDSDTIQYRGISLNKSDIEDITSLLEDPDNLKAYHFLSNFPTLNSFLATGQLNYFSSNKSQHPPLPVSLDFIEKLVSPFFAEQFNKALTTAFNGGDFVTVQKLFSKRILVKPTDESKAYRGITQELVNRIKRIELIDHTLTVKGEKGENLDENIVQMLRNEVNVEILNLLPKSFQALRNQTALAIRGLSVTVFNHFGNDQKALKLLEYALKLNLDGLANDKLLADKKQIDTIIADRQDQIRIQGVFTKYGGIVKGIIDHLEAVKSKTTYPIAIKSWAIQNISVGDINRLEGEFSEIRDQIAIGLKALSVEVWNQYSDIDVAIFLIDLSLTINIQNSELSENINNAKRQLSDMKRQRDSALQSVSSVPKPNLVQPKLSSASPKAPTQSNESNGSTLLYLLVFMFIVFFMVFLNTQDDTSSGSTQSVVDPTVDYSTSSTTPDSTIMTMDSSSSPEKQYDLPLSNEVEQNPYKGNQLSNGASPFSNCFGKGRYGGQAFIIFDNSNDYDAVVSLVNVSSGQTIRNEYIQAGSSFKMSRIPTGIYYLKVYYGKDWNPLKENFCGTTGGFETEEHFSKSDDPSDYLQVENSEYSYTTGSVTLYAVPNGNMSSQPTNASDFFNR